MEVMDFQLTLEVVVIHGSHGFWSASLSDWYLRVPQTLTSKSGQL